MVIFLLHKSPAAVDLQDLPCLNNLPRPWVHRPCRHNLSSHPRIWEVISQCLKVCPHLKWDLLVLDSYIQVPRDLVCLPREYKVMVLEDLQDQVCLQVRVKCLLARVKYHWVLARCRCLQHVKCQVLILDLQVVFRLVLLDLQVVIQSVPS